MKTDCWNGQVTGSTEFCYQPMRQIALVVMQNLSGIADKGRASLAGALTEYDFEYPFDRVLFSYEGIAGEQSKAAVRFAKIHKKSFE